MSIDTRNSIQDVHYTPRTVQINRNMKGWLAITAAFAHTCSTEYEEELTSSHTLLSYHSVMSPFELIQRAIEIPSLRPSPPPPPSPKPTSKPESSHRFAPPHPPPLSPHLLSQPTPSLYFYSSHHNSPILATTHPNHHPPHHLTPAHPIHHIPILIMDRNIVIVDVLLLILEF